MSFREKQRLSFVPRVRTLDQIVREAEQHREAGRIDKARALAAELVMQHPYQSKAWALMGAVMFDADKAAAGRYFLRAKLLDPTNPSNYVFLAWCLRDQDGLVEARMHYIEQALALDPHCASAMKEKAALLNLQDRMDEALQCARAAIALEPNDPEARLQEAVFLLKIGDFERGWSLYERRWTSPLQVRFARKFGRHRWTGREDVAGKTVLVWPEQGFGDMIQFVRYAPLLAERGARVLVQCPPEVRALFSTLRDVEIVGTKDDLPTFDYHIPMLSLPAAFGTTIETVPGAPYLACPGDYGSAWRQMVAALPRPRIGLAWSGLTNKVPLMALHPIFTLPLSFVSLQHELPERDEGVAARWPGTSAWLVGQRFANFADTAALITDLDLVITIDTAVAHLAGAMGKRTWLMLPIGCEWRWMTGRSDSPWYPSMRIFRQRTPGNWTELAEDVAAALEGSVNDPG